MGPGERPDEIEITPAVTWALAKAPNRHVLRYFDRTGCDRATIHDLAEYIAEQQSGRFHDDPDAAAVHLHHSFLPELDHLNIIHYEAESKTARKPRDRSLPAEFKQQVMELDDD